MSFTKGRHAHIEIQLNGVGLPTGYLMPSELTEYGLKATQTPENHTPIGYGRSPDGSGENNDGTRYIKGDADVDLSFKSMLVTADVFTSLIQTQVDSVNIKVYLWGKVPGRKFAHLKGTVLSDWNSDAKNSGYVEIAGSFKGGTLTFEDVPA